LLHFRPHWSFTLAVLPILIALIALGTWQIERLHWKLGLIAEMHGNLAKPPLTLSQALRAGDAAQYRRVRLTGRFDNGKEAYLFTTGPNGEPVYHVLTPFILEDGQAVLVDRGLIPTAMLDPKMRAAGELNGVRRIVGVWRTPDRLGPFTPKPNLVRRIWYARDLAGIARADGVQLAAPVIIEADATPNPGGWPKGGQTVVDLPNNHFSYAITWFGLAWALVCIYFSWHLSRGRLGFARKT